MISTNNIRYFRFEEDFMEDGIRCIPMIVRFKLDLAGVKLKLSEWCRFSVDERSTLARLPCSDIEQVGRYRQLLVTMVRKQSGVDPVFIPVDDAPAWRNTTIVHPPLNDHASTHNRYVSLSQWRRLTDLQRFALLKLFKPGHENKNFLKAMDEFALTTQHERAFNY
jgi:hypothetical protein